MAITRTTDIITVFSSVMNTAHKVPTPSVGSLNIREDNLTLDEELSTDGFLPNYSFLTEGLTAASGLGFQVTDGAGSGLYEKDFDVAQAINSASGVITT